MGASESDAKKQEAGSPDLGKTGYRSGPRSWGLVRAEIEAEDGCEGPG